MENRYEGTHSRYFAIVSMGFFDNVHTEYFTYMVIMGAAPLLFVPPDLHASVSESATSAARSSGRFFDGPPTLSDCI